MISHNHYKTVDTLYCESLERIEELKARNKELEELIKQAIPWVSFYEGIDHDDEWEEWIEKAKKLLGKG